MTKFKVKEPKAFFKDSKHKRSLVINKTSSKGILFEVAGRPDALDNGHGDYALNEAVKIIDFFVDYFNVSYPMPKSSKFK